MTPEQLAELRKPFPPEVLEIKKVSGKEFTYVAQHAVTRRLIAVTEGNYSFTIVGEVILPYSDIEKDGRTIKRWLHKVHGRLTIGEHHWDGHGVAIVQENSGEDMWKGAESDALKKAATRIGVALDLYGKDIEAELALDSYIPPAEDENFEPASLEQRTYIRALYKQAGYVVRDKKGHEHHDDVTLERHLKAKFGRGILEISKEQAQDVIDKLTKPSAKEAET